MFQHPPTSFLAWLAPLFSSIALFLSSSALAQPDKRLTAEEAMASGEKDLEEAEALKVAGDLAAAEVRLESALFYFSAAHDMALEATGPLLGMGLAMSGLGKCDDAVKVLDQYLEKKAESSNPAAKEARSRCKVALGQESLISFRTKPKTATVLLRQGETSIYLGQTPTIPKAVPPGEYQVVFVRNGEEPVTRNLALEGGDDLALTTNLRHPGLSRLSWNPGALGVPRGVWWFSGGLLLGAGASFATAFVIFELNDLDQP